MKQAIILISLAAICLFFIGCQSQPQTFSRCRHAIVIYAFSAPQCIECDRQRPTVKAIEQLGVAKVYEVDMRQQPAIAAQMGVTDAPTYIVFVNGQFYYRGNSAVDIYNQLRGQR